MKKHTYLSPVAVLALLTADDILTLSAGENNENSVDFSEFGDI